MRAVETQYGGVALLFEQEPIPNQEPKLTEVARLRVVLPDDDPNLYLTPEQLDVLAQHCAQVAAILRANAKANDAADGTIL